MYISLVLGLTANAKQRQRKKQVWVGFAYGCESSGQVGTIVISGSLRNGILLPQY